MSEAAAKVDGVPPAGDDVADIIIVNWNTGDQLADCLRSIVAERGTAVGRVFVVDNGSTDGSADIDIAGIDITMIRVGENLGFGRACNLAATQSTAAMLLFLNPDTELYRGSVRAAVDYLADPGHAHVGVVGIKLVGRDGEAHRHCARLPTWRSFIGNSLGLTRIARRWFPPIVMVEFDHLTSRPIEHVMGAFYLIRRSLFEALGGFDEDYFVYLEDLDLSQRVALAGFEVHYLAEATAYHKQGGSSERVKAHRLFYALQSNIVYAHKHLGPAQAAAVTAVTLVVEPASRLVRALAYRSAADAKFTLQAFAMLYRDVPRIRKTIARDRSAGRRS